MSESNIAPITPNIKIPTEAPFRAVVENIKPERLHHVRALAVQNFNEAVASALNETILPIIFDEDNPTSFEIDPRVKDQMNGLSEVVTMLNQTREFDVELMLPDEDSYFGLMIRKNGYDFMMDIEFATVTPRGFKKPKVLTALYKNENLMAVFDLTRWDDWCIRGKPVIGGQESFIRESMELVGTRYVAAHYDTGLAKVFHAPSLR